MMSQALIVRSMYESDLPKVMQIERASYPIPWSENVFSECVRGNNLCYVLLDGDEIVGYAVISVILDETHLLNLCVAPEHGRRGYGRYFLKHLIQEADERESSMFFLEVRASNEAARQLYFSEGFNEVGIRPNYYPAKTGREDAVLMTLELRLDRYA